MRRIREQFAAEFKAARTRSQAGVRSTLLDVAAESDDPADRYTLLREAYDLAAGGGRPATIVQAAEELAQGYGADAVELKAEGLVGRRKPRRMRQSPEEIARTAAGGLRTSLPRRTRRALARS